MRFRTLAVFSERYELRFCSVFVLQRYRKSCCKEYHLHAVHLLYEIEKGHLLFCVTVGVRFWQLLYYYFVTL